MRMNHGSTLFVLDGKFASEVADAINVDRNRRATPTAFQELTDISAEVVVSISDELSFGFRDYLDESCAKWKIPSVGIYLTPTRIECGPAVIPGRTACFACYRRRISQHTATVAGYDLESSAKGLDLGYGPHHVTLASGLLALAVKELRNGPLGIGATVRSVNLVTGLPAQSSVVSVNRCKRCGNRFRGEDPSGTVPNFQ